MIGLVLATLSGLMAVAPFPQDPTVAGVVVNARTLAPVADARVTLVELGREAQTSAAGRFVFERVPPGTHTLTVSIVGFIFVRRLVTVAPGTPIDLTMPLAEGTDTHREVVTVTATVPREVGASTITLSSAELQVLRGVAADDPMRAMQALPGVATGDDFQAEFSVRGSSFRHVGTVIDGTPTPLLVHAVRGLGDSGSIAMVNTDVLSGASLSAAAHPRRYGDWLGATLAFDLREGARDRRAFRAAVSGTSASAVTEGPLGWARRGSWLLSLRKSYVDWLVRQIEPEIESTIGFLDTQIKFAYDVTSRQQIQVLAVIGDATYRKPSATGANQVYRSKTRSLLVSGLWRHVQGRAVTSQRLSLVTNRFHNTGSSGQQQADGTLLSLLWRGDVKLALGDATTLDAGLAADRDSIGQTFRDFVTLSGGGLRFRRAQQIDDARVTGGAWVGLSRQTMTGGLSAGARLTSDSGTNRTMASPWLIAERRLGGLTLTGGVSGAHQFPTLEHLGQAVESIRPERAWMADLGAARGLARGVRARVALFYRHERDVVRRVGEDRIENGKRVVAVPFPAVASSLNGHATGFDVVVERREGTGPTGWFSYSWARTRHHDRSTGERFDADFDQRHTLNTFVEQRLSYRMKASAKLRYGSNFPLVGYFEGTTDDLRLASTRNQVRLPPYLRVDLSGSRTFTFERSRLTVFVELINVTGRRNYGPAGGSIRANLDAEDYVQRLIPFVPSAGLLVEF
jgi:hypothetical protein